jgi:hypothetical protein
LETTGIPRRVSVAVAVAVERPHLVLDEEYRIVEVGPEAEAGFGPLRGRSLWDTFPGSRPLFEPYYERARRSGETVEFLQFYDGYVARVRAMPRGPYLELEWERLRRLDTLTLEALHESLGEMISALERQERRVRTPLEVIEGGRAS